VHNGRARESIPEFEAALRNPLYKSPDVALINAGKCSASIGNVAQAETYFRRALQLSPGNATAAYNLALIAFKSSRFDDARGWMKIVMQENNPPPEALHLGMCIERKQVTRRPSSPTCRSCATAILTPETKSIATGPASETGARRKPQACRRSTEVGRPRHGDPQSRSEDDEGDRRARVRPAGVKSSLNRRASTRSVDPGHGD
jgi:tetratricopeptide (TPR) repeat protein